MKFEIISECNKTCARAGLIHTDHGVIETPFFMPVGTYGAVKTQSSNEIKQLPSKILLSNTYHLYIRPGTEILEKAGGLHKFMNWDGIILTDDNSVTENSFLVKTASSAIDKVPFTKIQNIIRTY